MAEFYTLNYTQADGFSINFEETDTELSFVCLNLKLTENPTEEHIKGLADTIKTISPNGKEALLLNWFELCLKEGAKTGETKEFGDEDDRWTLPLLDTKSVQAFAKQLISVIPDSFTKLRFEDVDCENYEALLPLVENLPEHVSHLDLTDCDLSKVNQEQLNRALKSKKNLQVLNLAGALDDYDESMLQNLVDSLPESLQEVTLFDTDEGYIEWEFHQLLQKDKPDLKINLLKRPVFRSELPDINLSDVAKGIWNILSYATKSTAETLEPYYASATNHAADYYASATNYAANKYQQYQQTGSIFGQSEQTSPVVTEETSQVVTEEPSQVVTEEPSPVVTKEPSQVATKEPSPVLEQEQHSNVSSSFLLGFFQAMKHVSLILAAVVIGGLVGAGVGLAVSAVATPVAGLAAGIAAGATAAAVAIPTMYSFFSSSKTDNNEVKEADYDTGLVAN